MVKEKKRLHGSLFFAQKTHLSDKIEQDYFILRIDFQGGGQAAYE